MALAATAATLRPMAATDASIGFGGLLREWRHRRSVSQLELSLDADLSARHLSFVETGRSHPSREVVVRLAECLQIPLRERNALLLAAGYAPVYGERPYDSPEMQPVRDALERFLRAHEPYPALVIDRRHNLLSANDALLALTDGCAPHLLEPPANAIRVALHPEGLAPRTENLAEWSSHLLARLRREAAVTGDPELEALYEEVSALSGRGRRGAAAGARGGRDRRPAATAPRRGGGPLLHVDHLHLRHRRRRDACRSSRSRPSIRRTPSTALHMLRQLGG